MSTLAKPKTIMTICGYCSTGKHSLCPHAIANGKKGPWLCTCEEANCGGKILSCVLCKKVHDDVSPDTRRCVDKDACDARITTKRDANPIFQNITRIKEIHMAKQAEQTKTERVAKAKTGVCKCGCEGETKGGNFLPGHDARFVSTKVGLVMDKKQKAEVARREIATVSETLAAKFDKSLGLAQEREDKKAAAAKEKAEAKAKADAEAKAAKAKADKA